MTEPPPPPPISCYPWTSDGGTLLHFAGPPLDQGPLPAFFYFALSSEESLSLDPFNQPVAFLAEAPIRIFSLTLPFHDEKGSKLTAVDRWAESIRGGNKLLNEFVENCRGLIKELIHKELVDPQRVALGGLSRGGFVATHLAAICPEIKTLLAFAPMTRFRGEHPLTDLLALEHLTSKLFDKNIRYYIGNRDMRVGTQYCFAFIQKLVEEAHHHKIRSPSIELRISPSIGYKGHGTSPQVFYEGVEWLKHILLAPKEEAETL